LILFALATLGATVVAFVLYPVFSQAREPEVGTTGSVERELISLEEKKTRLYDAITDLDFEKDAGKVSDSDYQTARNDYMAQVAEILTRIDVLTPKQPDKSEKPEQSGRSERKGEKKKKGGDDGSSLVCGSCGKSSRADSKFCMHCGTPFGPVCVECGETLPAQAKFCMACGHRVSA
jgi:Double zinc ribbon